MEPELRKVTTKLNRWLGELYSTLVAIQRDMARLHSDNLTPELKVLKDALANRASQMRTKIDNEKKSLAILQRTPPGFKSSVIDFMYNIIVDPSAPTQKEQFYEKLRDLDRQINKNFVSPESALGVPEYVMEEGVRKAITTTLETWDNTPQGPQLKPLEPTHRDNLIESLATAADPLVKHSFSEKHVVSTQRLAEGINSLKEILSGTLADPRQIAMALEQFINQLEASISETVTPEKKENLKRGFARVRQTMQAALTAKASIKLASASQQIQELVSSIQNLGDGQSFINEIEAVASKLSSSASQAEVDIAYKYLNYVKALLTDSRDSIRNQIALLNENLKKISEQLQSEENSPSDPAQPQSPPAPQE